MSPFTPPWVTSIPSAEELERFLEDPREQQAAGAVELRLDLWQKTADLRSILERLPGDVIVTWRENGEEREKERFGALQAALSGQLGKCWVDLDRGDPFWNRLDLAPRQAQLIASAHLDTQPSDGELATIFAQLLSYGVDAIKVVLPGGGFGEVRKCLALCRHPFPVPRVVCCGGITGSATRVLASAAGSAWAYGRLLGSRGTDPGQPATALVGSRYRLLGEGITPGLFAVIGSDVHRSLSPGFHNRVLGENGRDEVFVDVSINDPEGVLATDREFGLGGISVTTPHKRWARAAVPARNDEDAAYPAWNTLVREDDDSWQGYNTDGPAVLHLLERSGLRPGSRVSILGGGGAALGCAVAMKRAGHAVSLLVRRRQVRRQLEEEGWVMGDAQSLTECCAIINATGAGRSEMDLPLGSIADLGPRVIALEMSYDPQSSDLFQPLAAGGARVISGLEMFAEQARLQAELFFQITLEPEEALRIGQAAWHELASDSMAPLSTG